MSASTEDLRVLTVRQPWASAIAAGVKLVENRTRPVSFRGLLAIHAGLEVDQHALMRPPYRNERPQHLVEWLRSRPDEERHTKLPRGVVLAVARLTGSHLSLDCDGSCGPWGEHAPEVWHWTLAGVVRLDRPIPWRGGLGLRRAPDLHDQIERRKASTAMGIDTGMTDG